MLLPVSASRYGSELAALNLVGAVVVLILVPLGTRVQENGLEF